jgi:hypothetical protein
MGGQDGECICHLCVCVCVCVCIRLSVPVILVILLIRISGDKVVGEKNEDEGSRDGVVFRVFPFLSL